mgnify:CR=1 FL=1
MGTYDQLRVLSYRLRPAALQPLPYWQVSFPEKWKEPIIALQASQTRRSRPETSVPINSLNHSIRAFLPNVIGIDSRAGTIGPKPWIFADGPIDLRVLHHVARSWVKVHYGQQADVDRVLSTMRVEDLAGEHAQQAVEIGQSRGGTADPGGRLFMLVPNLLAANLASGGQWLDEGQGARDLVRVVGGADSPAEVMSWPPYAHRRRDGDWHFSLVLRFSLQTVPFDERPVVNLELITRRWLRASGPKNFFSLGKEQASTAYFRSRVHWLGDGVASDSFQVAPVGWQRRDEGWELGWKDRIGQLASELSWPRFPDVQRLSKDPAACMAGDPTIAIAFDTGLKPDHEVAAGWMPGDRKPMFEQASQKLADLLEPVPNLERKAPRSTRRATKLDVEMPPRPDDDDERKAWARLRQARGEQAERRQIIGSVTGTCLRVELLHQTAEMVHVLRDALTELIGITAEDQGSRYSWRWDGASIDLDIRRLGALGAELPVAAEPKLAQEYLRCVVERAQRVRDELQRTSSRGCIIELQGAAAFGRTAGGDPKDAIRKGAAMAGRVTQFITPPAVKSALTEEEDGAGGGVEHRARAAWLDLFRQLGAVPTDLDFSAPEHALPSDLQMVGVWLLNLNWSPERPGVRLPVIVCMSGNGKPPIARIATPELPDWLPYPEALAALGARPKLQFHEFGKDSVVHFLRDALEADLLPRGPVLLMASAQNLRLSWKWLQNGALVKDQVHLPPGNPRTIANWAGLRLARVRGSERGETPECYAEDGEDVGLSKGLWRWSDRVYASTANKPDAMKVVSPSQSRLRSYQTSKGASRDAAPNRVAWNPAFLEITAAALQEGDDPAVWAHAVHQLRFAAVHFGDGLALPLPLHLAKQMEEYVLPVESVRNQ